MKAQLSLTLRKLFIIFCLNFLVLGIYSQNYLSFDKLKKSNGELKTLPDRIINDKDPTYIEIEYDFPGSFVTEKSVDSTFNFFHIVI